MHSSKQGNRKRNKRKRGAQTKQLPLQTTPTQGA